MFICHWTDELVFKTFTLKENDKDYETKLSTHSMAWSIIILLPIMFLLKTNGIVLFLFMIVNAAITYIVDDCYYDSKKISLKTFEIIHIIQITLTLTLFMFIF